MMTGRSHSSVIKLCFLTTAVLLLTLNAVSSPVTEPCPSADFSGHRHARSYYKSLPCGYYSNQWHSVPYGYYNGFIYRNPVPYGYSHNYNIYKNPVYHEHNSKPLHKDKVRKKPKRRRRPYFLGNRRLASRRQGR